MSGRILGSDRGVDHARYTETHVANGGRWIRRQRGMDTRHRFGPDVVKSFANSTDEFSDKVRLIDWLRSLDALGL